MTKTNVTLVLMSETHSETFPNFKGRIPHKGEYIIYYAFEHDGCIYGGTVKKVSHRIEYEIQGDKKSRILQRAIVELDGKITETF